MRRIKARTSQRPTPQRARTESALPMSRHGEELMELAVEAAQSRHLPDFLEQFALRATRMLDAIWGGVAVYRGRETELHSAKRTNGATWSTCEEWLIASARESRNEVDARTVPKEIAATFEGAAAAAVAVFVRIAGSDNERLGTLCLIRKRKGLDGDEKRLLHALASHAALSLENFRRFSQLERSKRQWVEDIDAISDYIVVHDRTWNIVRTNRSLASHLGVPPVALVGEAMSSLRQIAETGSELPCPFCRDTKRMREEYVAASSSETPGVREVDTRNIRSAEAATYSSRIRLVSRQKGQGSSLTVSAICRKLLIASPTRATGGTPRCDARERFVRTIFHARSCTTM